MEKYTKYLNTVLLLLIAGLLVFGGKGTTSPKDVSLGAAPPVETASQFYDLALDSDVRGNATLYVNGRPVVASTSAGVTGALTTITATTSITDAGSLDVTGTSTLAATITGTGVITFNTSTTISSTTLAAGDFCGKSVMNVTATNNTTSTIQLPAATSTNVTGCLGANGASKTILIVAATSSAHTVTIASSSGWYTGTGVQLLRDFNVSSTFTFLGNEAMELTITRIGTASTTATVSRKGL